MSRSSQELSTRFLWNRLARWGAFWLLVTIFASILYASWASLSLLDVLAISAEGFGGELARVSTAAFAFSLAKALASLAFGLVIAFGVMHAVMASVSIRRARALVESSPSRRTFANDFDQIRKRMSAHPLLGNAWKRFEESVLTGGAPLRSTQRPQTFFNYAMLRENLVGLKIMPGIPSYFVGAGLLLTFIGLLIALYKAAEGTQAAQLAAGGAGAAAMQAALRDLLHAATFKFATSIAGLASSIVLAFVFRLYTIRIEASLGDFCEALESKLSYLSPQSISVEMRDSLAKQLAHLEEINSESFVARFGEDVAPSLSAAMTHALLPLSEQIGAAMEQSGQTSQSGVHELVEKFSETLQGGATAELRDLAAGLRAAMDAMEGVRRDMSRAGEGFAAKLGEAADHLSRLISDAGSHLGQQSETSRATLEQMISSLPQAFDQASKSVDANMSSAAENAAGKFTAAMDGLISKLEAQVGALERGFGGFGQSAADHIASVQKQMSQAHEKGAQAVAESSSRAASALEEGLTSAIKSIRKEAEGFSSALHSASTALGAQVEAIEKASARSRESADIFGKSAEAFQSAADPVTRASEKVADFAATVGETVKRATNTLDESQEATRALSQTIAAQVERLTKLWESYESRFAKVDEDLQRAFEKLTEETTKQSQLLTERTNQIDKGLAGAVDKLAGPVQGIGDGAQELSDAVVELRHILKDARAAA